MCDCFHRAGAKKISLKNGVSTPTFSFSVGAFRRQTNAIGQMEEARSFICWIFSIRRGNYRLATAPINRSHVSSFCLFTSYFELAQLALHGRLFLDARRSFYTNFLAGAGAELSRANLGWRPTGIAGKIENF
jgi:hypothetical protein